MVEKIKMLSIIEQI